MKTGYETRVGAIYGFLAVFIVAAFVLGLYSTLAGPIARTSHVVRVDTSKAAIVKAAEDTTIESATSSGVKLVSQKVKSYTKKGDKVAVVIIATDTAGKKYEVVVLVSRATGYQAAVVTATPTG